MKLFDKGRRTALSRLGGLGIASLWPLGSQAQHAATPPASPTGWAPTRGQAGKDVIWLPTPDALVQRMLQMAEVQASDHVFDLGSGDGNIAIAAGRRGAWATGLEFNPQLVTLAQRLAQQAGVQERVGFERADIFEADFSAATVVTLYLLPELNLRLRPKLFRLAPGTRVVSHSFSMGEWLADERTRMGNAQLFLWRIPVNASGIWRLQAAKNAGLPQTLQLHQTFQVLRGEGNEGPISMVLIDPKLSGRRLTFGLRDSAGRVLQAQAQVQADHMHGSFSRGNEPAQPFEAERVSAPEPIVAPAVEGG